MINNNLKKIMIFRIYIVNDEMIYIKKFMNIFKINMEIRILKPFKH